MKVSPFSICFTCLDSLFVTFFWSLSFSVEIKWFRAARLAYKSTLNKMIKRRTRKIAVIKSVNICRLFYFSSLSLPSSWSQDSSFYLAAIAIFLQYSSGFWSLLKAFSQCNRLVSIDFNPINHIAMITRKISQNSQGVMLPLVQEIKCISRMSLVLYLEYDNIKFQKVSVELLRLAIRSFEN